jgi:hypothetical protein
MKAKNPRRGIRLQSNDLEILRSIEDHGFRTYSELRPGALFGYERSYSWKVMKRLSEAGLVREIRESEGKLVGWASIAAGRREIQGQVDRVPIERGKIPKYASSFHHDKEVRWALDQFKMVPAVKRVVTESRLKEGIFSSIRAYSRKELNRISALVPDASLTVRQGIYEYRVAFEMELSRKSNPRIYAKIEHYLTKSGYDFVLYVCGDELIARHILKNHRSVLAHSAPVKFAKKEVPIYIGLLSELRGGLYQAKFLGIKDEFSFEQLRE